MRFTVLLCVVLGLCVNSSSGTTVEQTPPHIIFMLADDLGYNNVGVQQKKVGHTHEINSPAIDKLASTGMVLERMYSYKYCSPSRSSFLSGRLPIHVTQNNKNNLVTNPGGADLRMKLLPEMLKQGPHPYQTSLIGKWHVGARSKENLPINRGFDSHFGFLKGGEDHLNQKSNDAGLSFTDLWRDHGPAYHENGTFSTIMYAAEAQKIIKNHAKTKPGTPLFMYLSWQAAHTPLEHPPGWDVKPVPNDTSDQARAKLNALVEILDQGVKNVTDTLKEQGMWENTLLIFQADNGGWITEPSFGGNNYPLRGGKTSDFEGGVRNFALVNGGFLPTNLRGSSNKGLAHICDWYSTFVGLSYPNADEHGYEVHSGVPVVDSLDLWPSLTLPDSASSPRKEVPLSYCNAEAECDTPDSVGDAALIMGEWKIIKGTQGGIGIWQGPLYPNATSVPPNNEGCPNGCLFNVITDPTEHHDVREEYPEIYARLDARLEYYGTTVFQTNFTTANVCISATEAFKDNNGFLSPRCRNKGDQDQRPATKPVNSPDAAYDLTTEYLPSVYSLALGALPRFSWKIPLYSGIEYRGTDQTAYRLIVSRANGSKHLVWDSGIVRSNASSLIQYGGTPKLLEHDNSYEWSVQWFYLDSEKQLVPSAVSEASYFDVGLVNEDDWNGAKWIGGEQHRLVRVNLPRRSAPISRARVYVSAPGCIVLSANGKTHEQSATGVCPWTSFNKTIYYASFDVLGLLQTENNTVGFMLGHGMYTRQAGGTPAMKVKIVLDFQAASTERYVCVSGENKGSNGGSDCVWHGTQGPYISDDPFAGATIDWNKLPEKWNKASFDPTRASWTVVPEVSFPQTTAKIKGMAMPPTIDQNIFEPISVRYVNEYKGPVLVYDMGTNIVGTCRVKVSSNPPPGATLRMRHGEMLLQNGSLNLNYTGHDTGVKAHFQEDVHVLPQTTNGRADIYLRSAFVWYGFQYVSIEVSHKDIFDGKLDSIECYQMYPDMDDTGSISFVDDELSEKQGNIAAKLNALQHIIQVSQLGNLAQYAPTDCPTREKHFWLGDALSIAEEAMLNYGVAPLFANFLFIIADEQGHNTKFPKDFPGVVPVVVASSGEHNRIGKSLKGQPYQYGIGDVSWTAAFPIILNWMWKHYGDRRIVEELYPTSKEFVDFLHKEALLQLNSSLVSYYEWGDWCSNQSRIVARDSTGPPAAAFNYILALDAMADMAAVLDRDNDHRHYRSLGQEVRYEWHKAYYNSQHGLYGYAAEDGFAAQTLTTAPLAMEDVIPRDVFDKVVKNLKHDVESIRKYHQTFGSVGAKHFFTQLSNYGMHDAAIQVATQDSFPSFGYWISKGATSCWENWSGHSDPMHPPQPTHNHIFLCGGVGEWMYTHLSGMSLPATPGYTSVVVSPRISFSNGPGKSLMTLVTPYGTVSSNWTRVLPQSPGFQYGADISATFPKPGALEFHLGMLVPEEGYNQNYDRNIILKEGGKLIWENGKYISGVPGITGVELNKASNVLVASVVRGVFDFNVRLK